ncbi:uncharacterized protein LAESUDRAFT_548505 [Laetiporus sulphureus 93-53]|uniref:Uncharacterized protein n=1 Tax=Laetiporus sulphureus 93-53 TaxID=1314785 RepID=A0A165FRQ7_9APHY|nr:uncharacterized protein LAESUDRAFT_548505 [Laetiporus sulphureus 93-53]KZT09330.1 hypothetical protein LAESUDRAFT_548505 [Laetiporus sulphureus 93-53]
MMKLTWPRRAMTPGNQLQLMHRLDWGHTTAGFKAVQALKTTANTTVSPVNQLIINDGIPVRRGFYELKESANNDVNNESDAQGSSSDDTRHRFLLFNDTELALLNRRRCTIVNYDGIPIPAYSSRGKTIPPREYEARLCGALVSIKAAITHQVLGRNNLKTGNFFTYIGEM